MRAPLFTWEHLPQQQDLKRMTSLEVMDLLDSLNSTTMTIPETITQWFQTQLPQASKDECAKAVKSAIADGRKSYIEQLRQLVHEKFSHEPIESEHNQRFQELKARTDLIFLSVQLGLRSDKDKETITNAFHPQDNSQRHEVRVSDYDLKTYQGNPFLQTQYQERLDRWQKVVEHVETRIEILDPHVIQMRIEQVLSQPFNPSKQRIENTRQQLSSYDYDYSTAQAQAFLKKEYDAYQQSLKHWLSEIERQMEVDAGKRTHPKP